MIEPIQIVTTKKQAAVVLPVTTTFAELPKVMGPAVRELLEVVEQQQLQPTSSWWNHYTQMGATWVFDVGMTTTKKVTPTGRVKAGVLPAATVARTLYTGPYERLHEARAAFDAAIAAAGHETAAEIWEVYLKGPDANDDSAQFQTDLNRVVLTQKKTAKKKASTKKKRAKKKASTSTTKKKKKKKAPTKT